MKQKVFQDRYLLVKLTLYETLSNNVIIPQALKDEDSLQRGHELEKQKGNAILL